MQKRILRFLLCLCMVLSFLPQTARAADGIAIDSTNFPDENFRNYLLKQDFGEDGVLTEEEICNVTSLKLTGMDIADLTGVEYFISLNHLECQANRLTELDVSKNTALTTLWCGLNQLTELDIGKNTALIELICHSNQLTELDVSKNTALIELHCYDNQLTELDVSKNTALTKLSCAGNQLTELNVRKNIALTDLDASTNQLAALDVSKNTDLEYLKCSGNKLTSLDLTNNSKLGGQFGGAYCEDNSYSIQYNDDRKFDLSTLPGNFNVSKASDWVGGTVSGNILTIDSNAYKVTYTYQMNTSWSARFTLTVRDTAGQDVQINESNFPDENFRNYLLEQDYGEDGVLTGEEIGDITNLDVFGENIKDLTGVEYFTALECLECSSNGLSELDVSKNAQLEMLFCAENQLTQLDVSKNTALIYLGCASNQLTELDVSNNANLSMLGCIGNQLTELDVSQNTALTDLTCGDNRLTELDVSNNTALEYLECGGNQLTELDVSNNTALEYLECTGNKLTSLNLNNNVQLGGEYGGADCEGNSYSIHYDENGQFDLSTLPGNFDVSRASNWDGGTVNGNILTATAKKVTYTYRMNDTYSETFTLTTSSCTDNNHDGKCDICGKDTMGRISGKNRYITAVSIADQIQELKGTEKFDSIIIAAGDNFADALAGSYLANAKGAPILLSYGQGGNYAYLDSDNIAYIKENLAEGGTVYILGGTKAVPASYETELAGYNVKRLSGRNRFNTNLEILKAAGIPGGSEILVCTGYNYADSLSASATGKPILLVHNQKGTLYGVDEEFLSSLKNCTFTIIGGTGAVGNEFVEILEQYGTVRRLSGKTRYETSVLVAETYFEAPTSAVVAYAWNYPDGLCGGVLAYSLDAPLLLTKDGDEAAAAAYTARNGITSGIVLGGEKVISNATVENILGRK